MKLELEIVSKSVEKRTIQCFEVSQKAFTPFWHHHPEIELTLIKTGEGTRFVGDNISSFTDGDLILLGKYLPHHWVSSTSNSGVLQEAIVIQFLEKNLFKHSEFFPLAKLFQRAQYGLNFKNPDTITIDKIKALPNLTPAEQILSTLQILLELSHQNYDRLSSKTYQSKTSTAQSEKIDLITKYALDNLNRPISISEVANLSFMTPPSFCRWFKKQVGNTFTSFLNKARIESACQHLLISDSPINEIARKVGFDNVIYFNRVFKEFKHQTPKSFREENKKGPN